MKDTVEHPLLPPCDPITDCELESASASFSTNTKLNIASPSETQKSKTMKIFIISPYELCLFPSIVPSAFY